MSQITRPGIPGRTGSLNRNTELSALNEIIKRLKTLSSLNNSGGSSTSGLATLAEQQTQTTELNTLNTTVSSLLNNLIASKDIELLLVRDTTNNKIIQQIKEYDQGTGAFNIRYEDITGASYSPSGTLEYLDTTSSLNLILNELQSVVSNTNNNATEPKQDAIITLLRDILNKYDYEITKFVGFDSDTLIPLKLDNLSFDSLGLGGGFPPVFTTINSNVFETSLANANYSMSFNVLNDYSSTDIVNIFIKVEQSIVTPGFEGLNFYLKEGGLGFTATTLDVQTTGIFTPGDVKIIHLTYDNRTTNISNFDIHFKAPWRGTYPPNQKYKITLLGSTSSTYKPSDQITEYIKWENNIQSGVEYRDYLNQPYTLIGFFIKDVNKATEERLSTYLSNIDNNISRLTNSISRNTFNQKLLPVSSTTDLYSNFKELTFTVISGTVDVTVGLATPITFPIGNVVGATYSSDDLSDTNISINRTNGTYLITIKS